MRLPSLWESPRINENDTKIKTTRGLVVFNLQFFDVRTAAFVLDMLEPLPHPKNGYVIFQIEVGFHIFDIRVGKQVLQDGNHKGRQPRHTVFGHNADQGKVD